MNPVRKFHFVSQQAAKTLAMPYLRARFRREIRRFEAPYSLHLGCGSHRLDGWVNIDFIRTPAVDVWWNLGQPIPLAEGSCRYVFHEHVLEHFELQRGLGLLRECHRLLEPGGVLRVAMPSLDEMIANYTSGDWRTVRTAHMPAVSTRAEYLNVMFRNWGHQWIYNYEELSRRLHETGFQRIEPAEHSDSVFPELRGIEHRDDSLLISEAVKSSV